MAWTTPLTAVANATLTSAQYNVHCRDNFIETEAAKATGTWFSNEAYCLMMSSAANQIKERAIKSSIVQKTGTGQTTSSTSYTDLSTFGPSVNIITGTQVLCIYSCLLNSTTANVTSSASVEVSGASTVAASDEWRIEVDGHSAASGDDNMLRRTNWKFFSGLTAGVNTFTMKYKVSSGTGQFNYRHLAVWAL